MTDVDDDQAEGPQPPSALRVLVAFGGLAASLVAGYGVLFTIVDDYNTEYGISESQVGIIISVGFLSGFLSQLLIAPIADRGHARHLVIAGVFVNAAGLVMMALGTSLLPILIGRFVSGVGVGAAIPAIRRIVILADPKNLGSNLGRLLSADVFGFAMGPVVSAVLVGPFGIGVPFYVIASVSLVLLPFVLRVPIDETAVDARPTKRLALDLLRIKPFAGATILAGTAFIMIGGFDALWALVHDELDTPEWIANLGITLFAMPLIVLGPIGGRVAQTFGPFRLAAIGLLGGACFMLGYGFMPTGIAIFVLSLFHALNDGFTIAAPGVAAGLVVPEERQAGAQGMLGASQAVMAGIMAFVTGYVYEWFGRTAAYSLVAGVMVVLVSLGLWLARDAWRLTRPLDDTDGTDGTAGVEPLEAPPARRAGPADPAIVTDR